MKTRSSCLNIWFYKMVVIWEVAVKVMFVIVEYLEHNIMRLPTLLKRLICVDETYPHGRLLRFYEIQVINFFLYLVLQLSHIAM